MKKFRKFLIVNFRLLKNFLLLNSLQKKFEIFYSQFHWKTFRIFFRKSEKNFLPKKKRGSQGGGICSFFQQNPTRPFVGFWPFLFFFCFFHQKYFFQNFFPYLEKIQNEKKTLFYPRMVSPCNAIDTPPPLTDTPPLFFGFWIAKIYYRKSLIKIYCRKSLVNLLLIENPWW